MGIRVAVRPGLIAAVAGLTMSSAEVRAHDPALHEGYHDTVHYDHAHPDGTLEGGMVELFVPPVRPEDVTEVVQVATLSALRGIPNPANRIDVVFVGDGYTAPELALYESQVDSFADGMFSIEPFTSYRPLFNVHRVDVVSNESGVDNDPTRGVLRDTALDMQYWCNGTERLLCVNVGKALGAAANAPGRDLTIALANSSKYGGAGYISSDLGTASAGNSLAVDIILHEAGHALGNLADEYTYGGPANYNGGESSRANLSIRDASNMLATSTKWHAWLGESFSQFDGFVDTYEGGGYSETGIYRPSNNSMMRALGRPFNIVSTEQLVIEFWRLANPIDGSSHPAGSVVPGNAEVSVEVLQPETNTVEVEWFIDGVLVGDGPSFFPSVLGLEPGGYQLKAVATDRTAWVRNEVLRNAYMTGERSWTLSVESSCRPDRSTDGANPNDPGYGIPDGQVTISDLTWYIERWWIFREQVADVTTTGANPGDPGYGVPDGVVDVTDLTTFIEFWLAGCP
ncbi:MAG: M64 family metallopeptidase [Planctomycetota bacterium]